MFDEQTQVMQGHVRTVRTSDTYNLAPQLLMAAGMGFCSSL